MHTEPYTTPLKGSLVVSLFAGALALPYAETDVTSAFTLNMLALNVCQVALVSLASVYAYKEFFMKARLGFVPTNKPVPVDRQGKMTQHDQIARRVFDCSHDSIVILDASYAICAVNATFTHITGYCEHEVLGKRPDFLNAGAVGSHDYDEMTHDLLNGDTWSGEASGRKKDGSFFAGWLSISRVKEDGSCKVFYICIMNDVSLSHRNSYQRAHQLAYYDALTKLPNRELLKERMKMAVSVCNREKRSFAVLFVDIDNFKKVNDEFGHEAGDILLESIATRLKTMVREVDTVARLGGDEFVVLLQNIDRSNTKRIAMKIVSAINDRYVTEGGAFNISPSIGISMYPVDALDSESLLRCADVALYKVKGLGKNGYSFYGAEREAREFCSLFVMETALHDAMVRSQLKLYYQPQFDVTHNQVVAVEALIRWEHPDHGLIPPNTFIQVAEENGLIVQIGEYVLAEACRQIRYWIDNDVPEVTVSINVSAAQLENEDFVTVTKNIIQSFGIPPERLEMELTERTVMSDVKIASDVMQELTDFGIKFAIDDFGAGYSCLSYLCKLPLYKLKIDKSFVDDIATSEKERGLVAGIVNIATALGLVVVAEGVETKSQLDILTGQNCHIIQGYYFSRAVPAPECTALLARRSRRADEVSAINDVEVAQW